MAVFFVWCMVQAVEHFDYSKYKKSYKIQAVVNWLKKHGVDLSKMDWSTIFATFRGQLMDTLTAVIAFSEGIVLTSLMFFFCLYAMLPNPHDKRRRKQGIKHLMQSYLLWKTISSAVIGAAVGFCLYVMRVDLAFVFGMLTFVLNFIPTP
ncbi:FP1, partial [Symbiodinium sp. CCMP2456]